MDFFGKSLKCKFRALSPKDGNLHFLRKHKLLLWFALPGACTYGALRWPSRCLQLAPLSSRMVTCTASKTPHALHIFERVPDNVYVYAARRTAAWRTPTVAKFLRYLPLRLSPRERVGYRLHSGQHNVQPRPCPLHKYLFHQHMARSCAVLCLSTRGVRLR